MSINDYKHHLHHPPSINLYVNNTNQILLQSPLHHHNLNAASAGGFTYLNDADKAFDDVVFDILKVEPEQIAVS
jgi:hypothetical protein